MTKLIPLLRPFVAPEAIDFVKKTFESGWVGAGKKVEEFESIAGKFVQNDKLLSLNSCTSAINLSLKIAGITRTDEVITTPMTCVATNAPLLHLGSKIVWADISPYDGTISTQSIEERITNLTKAIIVVHYGGYPCDLDLIKQIATKNKLLVIEDAAHAFGSSYKGIPIGSHSDFVCFSFQSVKIITTIDGGGLALKNLEHYQMARKLRWYGIDRSLGNFMNSDITDLGFRYTLNDVLASIGIANMKYVEVILKRRHEIASIYCAELGNVNEIQICHGVDERRRSSYYLFPILVPDKKQFITLLKLAGVECSPVHRRNDLYSAFADYYRDDLFGVDVWDRKMVCLPIGEWLSDEEVWHVVKTIKAGY